MTALDSARAYQGLSRLRQCAASVRSGARPRKSPSTCPLPNVRHWCSMSDLGQLIAYWGYPAIFVVVVLGNVGLPVPEETTLIVAGYLVWQGYFRLTIVLAVGVISAVAGDNIGYWLGRRYGPAAVARVARWAAGNAERMELIRRFMLRHGALAVFLGRFFPGLRFMAGPPAGAAGVAFWAFFVANILGARAVVPYGAGPGDALGYGLAPYGADVRSVGRRVPVPG